MASKTSSHIAAAVLPLFRSNAELHRMHAVHRYSEGADKGIMMLKDIAWQGHGAEAIVGTRKALKSAVRVILRADDSNGSIGQVIKDLLDLHVELCLYTRPEPVELATWMLAFQLDREQDLFELDPVVYGAILGEAGLRHYRLGLGQVAASLPPEPSEAERRAVYQTIAESPEAWELQSGQRRLRFVLDHNFKRLAVLDRDVEKIIELHAEDQTRSYRLLDAARALAEIERYDLAIEWSHRAAFLERGHQAAGAADYWCELLHEHHPDAELAARQEIFKIWPTWGNAAKLHKLAGGAWNGIADNVLLALQANPREYVGFLSRELDDAALAWSEAHRLQLDEDLMWMSLVDRYWREDPAAVLPVLERLIESVLGVADVRNYRIAARRLVLLREIAILAGVPDQSVSMVATIRERHKRRSRLMQELDRAGL